ncbi:uncharacterized protein HKW66_Vig0068670 [Vigna angularis]|uniref:Uncharacterized protein n=1 Tax=Phaseolus angularis TaxID=3914 RepID=A0A8T0K7J8_PHAAN|nr:uncharacterized protein HKW66_Vig0068670 [Vigna angularis]
MWKRQSPMTDTVKLRSDAFKMKFGSMSIGIQFKHRTFLVIEISQVSVMETVLKALSGAENKILYHMEVYSDPFKVAGTDMKVYMMIKGKIIKRSKARFSNSHSKQPVIALFQDFDAFSPMQPIEVYEKMSKPKSKI